VLSRTDDEEARKLWLHPVLERGEYHMNSPELSKALHKAIADQKNYEHYKVYKQYLETDQ
jgi:glutamate synthase domain-containing protein 2